MAEQNYSEENPLNEPVETPPMAPETVEPSPKAAQDGTEEAGGSLHPGSDDATTAPTEDQQIELADAAAETTPDVDQPAVAPEVPSEKTPPPGHVNVEDVKADTVNIIGQVNVVPKVGKVLDPDKLPLVELKPQEWRKVKAVFVPSSDYQTEKSREKSSEERVFVIYGLEHAGKFTCAVHLGLDLHGEGQIVEPKFKVYRRTTRDTQSLVDFVSNPELTKDTIYIIENAFENGVDLADLASPHLATINETLQLHKTSYLILTTTFPPERLDALPVLGKISAAIDKSADISLALENHLAYYGSNYDIAPVPKELIALVDKERAKLEKHFKQPFHVDRFCSELSRLSPEAGTDDLVSLAERIGRIEQMPPRPWFERLSSNAKLYALLVVLFDGLERLMLDEIYTLVVQKLRENGVSTLKDPRQIGLNDMLEIIHAQADAAHRIRFDNSAFEQEARRQIRNHHHLLWSFINVLVELIEAFKNPEYWEFRRALGAAIGRLGIYHFHKTYSLLDDLAGHPSGGVVAVAGYALDEVCRTDSGYYTVVTVLLNNWSNSGNPDLMWAATASIWRIYDGLSKSAAVGHSDEARKASETLEQVQEILTELARNFNHFNKEARQKALTMAFSKTEKLNELLQTQHQLVMPDEMVTTQMAQYLQQQLERWAVDIARSILHAIHWMALSHPQNIVRQIGSWLEAEEGSNLRQLGRLASRRLFFDNSNPEMKFLPERHLPLLDLVASLLSTDEDTINMVFDTLQVWLQRGESVDHIHEALLRVANRATLAEATNLHAGLSRRWLDSDSAEAQLLARAIIARLSAMAGLPMDLPGHSYGIIAVDASHKLREMQKTAAYVCRELYERLDTQIDVYVIRLGRTQKLAGPGQSVTTSNLQADQPQPRLLLPLLETFDLSRANFVLVLTWGAIIDFDDFWSKTWIPQVIVAAPRSIEWPEDLKVIPVNHQVSKDNLLAIETAIQARLAQILATLSSEEWWSSLQGYLQLDPPEPECIITKLGEWIAKLDRIETSKHPGDTARTIIGTILWLATTDLPRCVKTLQTWLVDENDLFQLIGAVCGRALFKLYAQLDPVPSVASHEVLLDLIVPLAKQSWDGAEVALHTARRWAVQSVWSERFLARSDGSPGELLQLVDAVLPANQEALIKLLNCWSEPLESEETLPEPVAQLAEHLQLRIALGTRQPLPDLPEGHTYGLIAVATVENSVRMQSLAILAGNIVKRLSENYKETLHLLVYRLGQDYPLTGLGQKSDLKVIFSSNLSQRPRLLGSLLEVYPSEQVSFVLLLTVDPILDWDDWSSTLWSERVVYYNDANRPAWLQMSKTAKAEEAELSIFKKLQEKLITEGE